MYQRPRSCHPLKDTDRPDPSEFLLALSSPWLRFFERDFFAGEKYNEDQNDGRLFHT
jgi:hypothetical protein